MGELSRRDLHGHSPAQDRDDRTLARPAAGRMRWRRRDAHEQYDVLDDRAVVYRAAVGEQHAVPGRAPGGAAARFAPAVVAVHLAGGGPKLADRKSTRLN